MALAAGPTSLPRRRGRPKGTGIDDAPRLATIRALLNDQPSLTPTAAIRASGVEDPSAIRRLRDKLGGGGSLVAEKKPTRLVKPADTPSAPASAPAKERRREAQPKPSSVAGSTRPGPATLPPDPPADLRKREAELLAAYLEALAKTAPETKSANAGFAPRPEPTPAEQAEPQAKPQPQQQPPPNPFAAMSGFGAMPNMMGMMQGMMPGMMPGLGMSSWPGLPSGTPFMAQIPPGMSIPGLPPFLQPFQGKQQPPAPGTSAARQLEAFKLAIEAMTAIARLQLHLIEQAPAYSPLALMLQGQTFIGQMMIAGLTGQMNALNRTPPQSDR